MDFRHADQPALFVFWLIYNLVNIKRPRVKFLQQEKRKEFLHGSHLLIKIAVPTSCDAGILRKKGTHFQQIFGPIFQPIDRRERSMVKLPPVYSILFISLVEIKAS